MLWCNENLVAFVMHTAVWQLAESTLHACFESWHKLTQGSFQGEAQQCGNLVHTAQHNMKELYEKTQHNSKWLQCRKESRSSSPDTPLSKIVLRNVKDLLRASAS